MGWCEHFYYDETSPSCLRWAADAMRGRNYATYARRKGDVAGTAKGTSGRWQIILGGKHTLAHRIVYEIHWGEIEEGFQIDHIDGDYLNNKISNLRAVLPSVNVRNAKKNITNKTGVNGVHLTTNFNRHTGLPYCYYTATWHEDCRCKSKHFSIAKLGADLAFDMACEYRTKMIAELNEQGAGYTERHGT